MRSNPVVAYTILVLLLLIPVFGHLDHLPIVIWDESRLANNALDMLYSGNWLVTTFDDIPDMWNTKPPLLIWLQVISFKIFGINELAVRIPSALATLATCSAIYWFFARHFKAAWLGFIAAFILITSAGYVHLHGSRTGDYDALLVFFTTTYSLCFFLYIEQEHKKYIYLAFVLLTLAVLTKGVAGLLFLPALFIYSIIRQKVLVIIKSRETYIGFAIFIVFVGGYYVLRERYNHGYLQSVWYNELGGRFNGIGEHISDDKLYYLNWMRFNGLSWYYTLLIPGVLLGLFNSDTKIRRFTTFSVLIIISFFIIISISRTKLFWYSMAAYPYLAIIGAIALYTIADVYIKYGDNKFRRFIVVACMVSIFIIPYKKIVTFVTAPFENEQYNEERVMGFYMKEVIRNKTDLNGYTLVWNIYQPDIYWYKRVLEKRGEDIPVTGQVSLLGHEKVIVFKSEIKNFIENKFNVQVLDSFQCVKMYQLKGIRDSSLINQAASL
jgi:4-amino-4-deoxy-L-arabinose transferase-like glycosyltransferase